MRKFLLGAASVAALAAAVEAVEVRYVLRYGTDGIDTTPDTPDMFSVYAQVTPDNGGLYGFGIDLQPGAGGAIATLVNRTPNYTVTSPDESESRSMGFGLLRSESLDVPGGKMGGGQGLVAAGSFTIYGFGNQPGAREQFAPAGWTFAPGPGGGGRPSWATPALMASGTWTGERPVWQTGSVDNGAVVYLNTTSLDKINVVPLLIIEGGPTPTEKAEFAATADTPVLGTVDVTQSGPGNYASSVLNITPPPGAGAGGVNVNTIGEAGLRYVMLDLGGTGDPVAALAAIDALAGVDVIENAAEDPEYGDLQGAYGSKFDGGSFDALLRLNAAAGQNAFNFNLGTGSNVTVEQIAVVPEPATIGLLSVIGLGLMARRRRVA